MSTSTGAIDAHIIAERLGYALPDGTKLFHELTLSVGLERIGLIGPNGSGKTTLLRLLTGELQPSTGTIRSAGVIAVLPQEFRAPPGASLTALLGIDERLRALRRLDLGDATTTDLDLIDNDWNLEERVKEALKNFGLGHLPLDRPLGAISGGEATRVALAGLALRRPDVLLLDEPTNHLDRDSQMALYAFLEGWQGGALCSSHDRALLRRMDRILELSGLGARSYGGNYDDYRNQRDAEAAAALDELGSARAALRRAERRSREVRERQVRKEARGRHERATANLPKILLNARKGQAESTAARVRAVTDREVQERRERLTQARKRVEERERPRFDLPSTELHANRVVLEIDGVEVSFPGSPRSVIDDFSIRVVGPERVAVVGPNGSGKTTLLHVAAGVRAPDRGTVRRLPDTATAFLDQNGAALDPNGSLLDNIRAFHPRMDEGSARYALARFLFPDDAALRRVGTLSGGERLRASLACVLGGPEPPSLLLLDEPTNHLDLDAMEALEAALRGYDGALLVVSHDEDFLEAIEVDRRVLLG